MQVFPVGKATIVFVLHPQNSVTLTEDQVRTVFAGEATNWKELGGADSPILVVLEANGQGTRAVVESLFMKGKPFVANARVLQVLTQLTQVVSQAPNAISYGNGSSMKDVTLKVVPGVEVMQPLALVTKGAPTPEQKKLIDAIVAAGGQ